MWCIKLKKCLSSPNNFIKFIAVISCIYFSIHQVKLCVEKLLTPPITTHFGFHLNDSIAYPSVTICRRPGFNDDLFSKFGMRSGQTLISYNAFRTFDFENYTVEEFLEETTYSFKKVFASYAYNGVGMPSEDLVETSSFHSISRGKCFTFTPKITSNIYGISGGWWFFMGLVQTEPLADSYGVSQYGYHIYVHDMNEIMTSDDNQAENFLEYISLEDMEDIRLHLKYEEFFRVNTKENPCIDPADEPSYSRSRCLEKCLYTKIFNITNCSLPWLWLLPSTLTQCNDFENVSLLISYFLPHNKAELIRDCYCPNSCHVAIYTPTIVRRKEIDEKDVPHSFIAMYYTTNLITEMREVVGYNFSAFFSDIGGSLGFLLGLSVVGFMKAIEIILCNIIRRFYKKRVEPDDKHQNINSNANKLDVINNASKSTKLGDEILLENRNNASKNMILYENLRDFDSDDFKHYQKTLVADPKAGRY